MLDSFVYVRVATTNKPSTTTNSQDIKLGELHQTEGVGQVCQMHTWTLAASTFVHVTRL